MRTADLTKRFKGEKLKVGAKGGDPVLADGYVGEVVTVTIRARKDPQLRTTCR